jgi:uncharacterized protein (TIGR03083 family)
MTDPQFDYVDAIVSHSAGLAAAADGHLEAPVPSCPGWTVADLVSHLMGVQWFWATIVEERLAEPPGSDRRPARPADPELLAGLRAQTERLSRVLRAADPTDSVYTWAPAQKDVAFIERHQVQEAAVHHWDAASAAGHSLVIPAPVAADSIEEFLTFSVSSPADPAEPARPALDGSLALWADDAGQGWTVTDGSVPGTVTWRRGIDQADPRITASASDLLLWLYNRIGLTGSAGAGALADRLRALTFTD